jgi:programmed cell death protein 5
VVKLEEDRELEELRRRKLEEYQRRLAEAYEREKERKEFEEKKAALLRRILTPEARSRLENIRLVKPELAEQLELYLIQLASAGRIKGVLTEEDIKKILKSITTTQETKIRILKKE